MVNSPKSAAAVTEDRVRDVAYALWLQEGQPHGRAEAHWFQAMELVNAEAMAEAAPAPVAKPKRKAPAAAAARKAVPAKRAPAKKA